MPGWLVKKPAIGGGLSLGGKRRESRDDRKLRTSRPGRLWLFTHSAAATGGQHSREIPHFRREQHRCWPHDSGNSRRGGDMTKIVALTLVIGVLVAGSAIFAKNHPRALTACVTNCE